MYWLVVLCVLSLISLISMSSVNKRLFFYFSLFVFFSSLILGYFNGMDFANYYYDFNQHIKGDGFMWNREPLYESLRYSLDLIFKDFYLSTILLYVLMFYLISKIKLGNEEINFNGSVFVLFLFLSSSVNLFSEQLRQAIAVCFLILYITNKIFKGKKCNWIILMSIFFHFSSILVFLVLFLMDKLKTKKQLAAMLILLLISIHFVLFNINVIGSFLPGMIYNKISFYLQLFDIKFRFGPFFLINIIIIILIFIFGNFRDEVHRYLLVGMAITCALQLSFYVFPIAQRFISSLMVFQCVYITIFISNWRVLKFNYISLFVFINLLAFFVATNSVRPFFGDDYHFFIDYIFGELNVDDLRDIRCADLDGFCKFF